MSERSVFAVSRGVFDHPIFAPEPFTEREAWLWMCGQAAWKPTRVRIGSAVVKLERGQLAFSTRFLARRWRWESHARVRRFLNRLKNDAMIDAAATHGATHVTICNYNKWAFGRRSGDPRSDASNDPAAIQQRSKEEELKNGRKEPPSLRSGGARARATQASRLPDDWMPSPNDLNFAATLLPANCASIEIDKFRDYWHAANGPPSVKRDWSAAWRNWCRKAVERGNGNGKAFGDRGGGFKLVAAEFAYRAAQQRADADHRPEETSPDLQPDDRPGHP